MGRSEASGKTYGKAARRRDSITREQPCEINKIKVVTEILDVELQPHCNPILLPEFRSYRGVDRQGRLPSKACEIYAVNYGLAILRQGLFVSTVEIDRQATAIFGANGAPQPW